MQSIESCVPNHVNEESIILGTGMAGEGGTCESVGRHGTGRSWCLEVRLHVKSSGVVATMPPPSGMRRACEGGVGGGLREHSSRLEVINKPAAFISTQHSLTNST